MKKVLLLSSGITVLTVLVIILYYLYHPGLFEQLITEQTVKPEPVSALTLRMGHNTPANSALHQAALQFAELVRKKSNGAMQVEVFPDQQLGNDHQMLEMARAGVLDIILTPTAKLSLAVPAMQYADLPFYFPSPEFLYQMLDGEPGKILLEKLQHIDLVGVTFWENGFKHFTANKAIQSPDDFIGLKIRTMKSRIIMEQFKSFGAHPIPIDFHSTRQALVDGVVDGQENPLIAIVSMGFHEVQSHLTLSKHAYLGYVFSISSLSYKKIPQHLRDIIISSARETTSKERQTTHSKELELLETIAQAGVKIHTLDEQQRQQFAKKTAHIPGLFEGLIGVDLISKTEELLLKRSQQAKIIIGLDTDLSMDASISGLAIKRGAQLAIDEINAQGGVLGKKLRLWAKDHKGMPTKSISNIQQFAENPELVAVLGGQHSPVIIGAMEAIQNAAIPFLATWSSAAKVVDNGYQPNYVFRLSANDHLSAPYIIDYVLEKYQRPAILLENSAWGRGNLEIMRRRLEEKGLAFVQIEKFNRGDTDFPLRLSRIANADSDVIILITKPLEGQLLFTEMAQQDAPLPVISHWGIIGGDFWGQSRQALEKVDLSFFQTFSFLSAHNARAQVLANKYIDRYGLSSARQIKAPTGVVHSYDLVHLLALAIKQAESTDRNAIRDQLENLKPYKGVVKYYKPAFTAQQHDALNAGNYQMARFAQDGAIIPVKSDKTR